MDAYLDLTATVLRLERRPLSSQAILAAGHRVGLVPRNLYGKTQHKTLAARISEDILAYRERSRFFRTARGRYFLREFLHDPTLPEDYRQPYSARRRIRELVRGPTLAIQEDLLQPAHGSGDTSIAASQILNLLRENLHTYLNPQRSSDAVLVRSFVCVRRGPKILSYRLGPYRDNRDTFVHKRSIGFTTLVHIDERTLFNVADAGIVEAGVRAVKIDLDIPPCPINAADAADDAVLLKFVWVSQSKGRGDLLAIVSYNCPAWFEPVKRRLALNDLEWIDANGINDVDDFDPWSKCVLEAHRKSKILTGSPGG